MNMKGSSVRTVCIVLLLCVADMFGVDVPDFFPEIQGDLTKVTWSHGVNSQAQLQDALQGEIMMLEADVSLGTLIGDESGTVMPIMAHPPTNTSDLSLEEFVSGVIGIDKKGIKLDFKSTATLEPALAILKSHSENLNFPVWLNADILTGPVLNTGTPVNPEAFFTACSRDFPNSVLSVGWTTTWGPLYINGSYTEKHVAQMIGALGNNTQAVTFPIRGGIGASSLTNIQTLLSATSNSTITVWGSDNDRVNVDKLREMILTVGKNRTYVDVPKDLLDELDLENYS